MSGIQDDVLSAVDFQYERNGVVEILGHTPSPDKFSSDVIISGLPFRLTVWKEREGDANYLNASHPLIICIGVSLRCTHQSRSETWSCTADVELDVTDAEQNTIHHTFRPTSEQIDIEKVLLSKMVEPAEEPKIEPALKATEAAQGDEAETDGAAPAATEETPAVEEQPAAPREKVEDPLPSPVDIVARITILEVTGIYRPRISTFDHKTAATDACLVVGGEKLYVSKQYLAEYSTFFNEKFFGDHESRGRSEFSLDDVKNISAFIDLLKMIYPENKAVSAANVGALLELARQFKFPAVTEQCDEYLCATTEVSQSTKVLWCATYRLHLLRNILYQQLTLDNIAKIRAELLQQNQLTPDAVVILFNKQTELIGLHGVLAVDHCTAQLATVRTIRDELKAAELNLQQSVADLKDALAKGVEMTIREATNVFVASLDKGVGRVSSLAESATGRDQSYTGLINHLGAQYQRSSDKIKTLIAETQKVATASAEQKTALMTSIQAILGNPRNGATNGTADKALFEIHLLIRSIDEMPHVERPRVQDFV